MDDEDGPATAKAPTTPSGPPLEGRRVRIRPVVPDDLQFLYLLATDERVSFRWRFRGVQPSPEVFSQLVWHGVLAQFIVEHNASGKAIGHLSAFNSDEGNGWCHIGVLLDPALSHTGWALESLALFFNYLFETFNFRKLYGEVLEIAYEDLASGANTWFRVEGRLVDHEYYGGKFWDLILLALHRDDWNRVGVPLVEKLTRGRPQP